MDNKVKEEAELRKEADVADAVYDAETGKLHLKTKLVKISRLLKALPAKRL